MTGIPGMEFTVTNGSLYGMYGTFKNYALVII